MLPKTYRGRFAFGVPVLIVARGGGETGKGGFQMVGWGMFERIAGFARAEDGAALTEYIVLLGVLIVGVVVAVLAFSAALSNVWTGWAGWLASGERFPTS